MAQDLQEISAIQFNALIFYNNEVLQACVTSKAKRHFAQSFMKPSGSTDFFFFLLRSPSDQLNFSRDIIIGTSILQPFAIFRVLNGTDFFLHEYYAGRPSSSPTISEIPTSFKLPLDVICPDYALTQLMIDHFHIDTTPPSFVTAAALTGP